MTNAPQLTTYVDGQLVVSADGLNTFEQTCDNLEQLRELVGTVGMQIFARGFEAVGDGGQGEFYWDENGLGPDNGTTIIRPNDVGEFGAWVRLGFLPWLNVFLPKTTEVPDATITGGFLYVDSTGALKYRGPTTITEIAPP